MELCEIDLYAYLKENGESMTLERAISYTSDIANGIVIKNINKNTLYILVKIGDIIILLNFLY
jgi:hypothetical protein